MIEGISYSRATEKHGKSGQTVVNFGYDVETSTSVASTQVSSISKQSTDATVTSEDEDGYTQLPSCLVYV